MVGEGFEVEGARDQSRLTTHKLLWNVFSQTMTVGLKPATLTEGVGIYPDLDSAGAHHFVRAKRHKCLLSLEPFGTICEFMQRRWETWVADWVY